MVYSDKKGNKTRVGADPPEKEYKMKKTRGSCLDDVKSHTVENPRVCFANYLPLKFIGIIN